MHPRISILTVVQIASSERLDTMSGQDRFWLEKQWPQRGITSVGPPVLPPKLANPSLSLPQVSLTKSGKKWENEARETLSNMHKDVFVMVRLVETFFSSSCLYSTHRHGRRVDGHTPTSLWVWGISGHPGSHYQQWGEMQDRWYNSMLINNPLCSIFSHGICSCIVCIYVTMAIITWS